MCLFFCLSGGFASQILCFVVLFCGSISSVCLRIPVQGLAGSGEPGFKTDWGLAATFNRPRAVVINKAEDMALISDRGSHRIRKINLKTKHVSDVVGSFLGESGAMDDFGPFASLNDPCGLEFGHSDWYAFVVDTGNHCVRRFIIPDSSMRTLIGKPGEAGYTDGVNQVVRFNKPFDLTLSSDGTWLLIADTGNRRIRHLSLPSRTVTTFAGSGITCSLSPYNSQPCSTNGVGTAASFHTPVSITLAPDDSIALVADEYNNNIRSIDISSKYVTTLVGVEATTTWGRYYTLNKPSSVTFGPKGQFALIADTGSNTIMHLNISNGLLTTIVGSGTNYSYVNGIGARSTFNMPEGVAVSGSGVFGLVADTGHNRVRILSTFTMAPTKSPTIAPTAPTNPTSSPTTANPTPWATRSPTVGPTFSPTLPTMAPTTVSPTTVSPSKSALACLEKDLEKTGFKVAFDLYPTFHVGGGGGGGGGGGPKKLPRELSGLKMWGWDKKATAEDLENANKAPSSEKRKDQPDKAKSNLASVMVRVVHGDILDQRVEAITNAANEHLRHDAALAAAIAEAAGSEQLAQESQAALKRVSLKPGGAVSTCSLALRSRGIQRIVHAVAPKFLQGSQSCKVQFQSAVMASLAEAESKQLTSLAIPLIGSGIFGWPTDLAAQLLTKKLVAWLSEHPTTSLREICLVDIDRAKVEAMVKGLRFVAQHGLHSSDSTTVCNTVDGVKHKQWQWTWSFPEKDKWVKYDEDQNVQLERAWHQHVANPSGVTHCRIMGDKGGVYSNSKHKPEDAPGAVYDVFFAEKHQKNVVSNFTRPVQRCQSTSPLPDLAIPVKQPAAAAALQTKVEVKVTELAPYSSGSCTSPSSSASDMA